MNPRYPSKIYDLFTKSSQQEYLSRAALSCADATNPRVAESLSHLNRPWVKVTEWQNREVITGHDIAAWVELVREKLAGSIAQDFHEGLTSSDLVDTALGFALQDAFELLRESRAEAVAQASQFAWSYRNSTIRGRTHGQDAEYVSVGRRVAVQTIRLARTPLNYYQMAKSTGPVGIGGGQYGDTQVVNRGILAAMMSQIVELSLAIEQLALDVRLMARSPERTVYTVRQGGHMGSSAMPNKNNPIEAERVYGLASVIRSNARTVQDSSVLWEERDISHSSVERTALVEALALSDYCLKQLGLMYGKLEADPALGKSKIFPPTAADAYSTLVSIGMGRDRAYRLIHDRGVDDALQSVHLKMFSKGYDPDSEPELWEMIKVYSRGS